VSASEHVGAVVAQQRKPVVNLVGFPTQSNTPERATGADTPDQLISTAPHAHGKLVTSAE
jgi:hypothetical protein